MKLVYDKINFDIKLNYVQGNMQVKKRNIIKGLDVVRLLKMLIFRTCTLNNCRPTKKEN